MALHGDLDSFALPDVLRLLAGTGKTGRLAVTAEPTSGEVWLLDGDLVGGRIDTAPHASEPADVVFELIRLESGDFAFEDGERLVDGAGRARVNDAIEAAEEMVAAWADVETVVPSVHATVRMATEIDGESVTVANDQWKLLAAMGTTTTVRALGDTFAMTDLAVCRQVKGLVEDGLIDLDADAQHLDMEAPPVADDLAILRDVDTPVVLESHDDAHLPEPLPGAGTTFAAEMSQLGTVDGRSFESFEDPVAAPAPERAEAPNNDETWATFNTLGADPLPPAAEAEDPSEAVADADADDDRGSLMRFLSQVDN